MTDDKLTVRVNADTDDAVEAIENVTEAVEELDAALTQLCGGVEPVVVEVCDSEGVVAGVDAEITED